MTNKISMDKKYRTRSGIAIRRILCVDRVGSVYPVVAETEGGCILFFTEHGESEYGNDRAYDHDLIEVAPYEDFKIDDKVMVRDCGSKGVWHKRYFAGVNSYGMPTTFSYGCDSWSNDGMNTLAWDECRKPTAEELAK